jgi:hypothetical protein
MADMTSAILGQILWGQIIVRSFEKIKFQFVGLLRVQNWRWWD